MFCYARRSLQNWLLPFAQEHKKKWLETLVVEDGATPYSHGFQQNLYSYSEIHKILWLGNSPDINMIEPVWGYLKKEISKDEPISTKEEALE